MTVVAFRKPTPLKPAVSTGLRSVAQQVNAIPAGLQDLDFSGVLRLEGPDAPDGSAQITYTAALEARMRQLTARLAMPRLPFTALELDALLAYAAYLFSGRADGLPNNQDWQEAAQRQADKYSPGWAQGLRYYIAQNYSALTEHHRTVCGYAELIQYQSLYDPQKEEPAD